MMEWKINCKIPFVVRIEAICRATYLGSLFRAKYEAMVLNITSSSSDDDDEDALLNAHLQHVGDVLCGLYPVLPGAHHVDGLRELGPEVRRELLGELVARAGAHLGVGHLHVRGRVELSTILREATQYQY